MADGTKKPIDQVKAGDEVLATDPETGKQVSKRVEQVLVHDEILTDLQLADGTLLVTTENHPYWSITDHRFKRADELTAGMEVLRAGGRRVKVLGLRPATAYQGRAYNLTV